MYCNLILLTVLMHSTTEHGMKATAASVSVSASTALEGGLLVIEAIRVGGIMSIVGTLVEG